MAELCLCRVLSGALTETSTCGWSKHIWFYYTPCNSRDRRERIERTLAGRDHLTVQQLENPRLAISLSKERFVRSYE